MSCAYRHAAIRIATIAGIPTDLMMTAMDIARQRRVTFPDLPPDQRSTITKLLGITPTCGNPQQVIARIQTALIALSTIHPTHPCIERWMAIAAVLGVPDDRLPRSVQPVTVETVCQQWMTDLPTTDDRVTAGIRALRSGIPIPTELIDEAIRAKDRQAIVTWMAHGVWDDRFKIMCQWLSAEEINTIVGAGVVPDILVEQIVGQYERWWVLKDLPWDIFPMTLWDRVADPAIARAGRARTAATKLRRHPTLYHDHLIDAAASEVYWAAEVLIRRHDLADDRLIAAVAEDPGYARNVLIERHDLSDPRLIAAVAKKSAYAIDVLNKRHDLSDPRLIAAVAKHSGYARDALIERHDLSDPRLIAAVAEKSAYARDVLIKRHDLSNDRLIAAVAENPWYTHEVLIARPDLRTDARLLTAIIRDRALVDSVLAQAPDLCDHPLLTAVRTPDGSSA